MHACPPTTPGRRTEGAEVLCVSQVLVSSSDLMTSSFFSRGHSRRGLSLLFSLVVLLLLLKVTQTEEDGTTNLPTDGEAEEEDADHGPDAEKMHPDCKQLPEAKNEPQEEELEVSSSHDPSPVLYSDPATSAPSSPLVVQSVRGISCSRETNLTRLRLPCGRRVAAGA